jgi:hypothetical protein
VDDIIIHPNITNPSILNLKIFIIIYCITYFLPIKSLLYIYSFVISLLFLIIDILYYLYFIYLFFIIVYWVFSVLLLYGRTPFLACKPQNTKLLTLNQRILFFIYSFYSYFLLYPILSSLFYSILFIRFLFFIILFFFITSYILLLKLYLACKPRNTHFITI